MTPVRKINQSSKENAATNQGQSRKHTVHEFEGNDNFIFDLAAAEGVNTVLFFSIDGF